MLNGWEAALSDNLCVCQYSPPPKLVASQAVSYIEVLTGRGVMVRKVIGVVVLLVLVASMSGCAMFSCTAPPVC